VKIPLVAPQARRASNRFGTLVLLALAPSLLVLGWRAVLVVVSIVGLSLLADTLLRPRRHDVRRWPVILPIDALLLTALLPAHLAGGLIDGGDASLWPVIPAAALGLSLARRARELAPSPAFDSVVVIALGLHLLLGAAGLSPRSALQRDTIAVGDVLNVTPQDVAVQPWMRRPHEPASAALSIPWAADQLDTYLSPAAAIRAGTSADLDSLIRDRLPPLEDLVLLGHPSPIGMCSGVVLLGAILWGAYRQTIDYRIPLLSITAAYLALVVLPIPAAVGTRGATWRFLAMAHPDVGLATALTFVHYLLFASPLLFCLGLLASRGDTRPLHTRAVVVWSVGLGVLSAVSVLYYSVQFGPLAVLLVAPVLARWLDRRLARRPMVLPD
jgi:hypothetical protein